MQLFVRAKTTVYITGAAYDEIEESYLMDLASPIELDDIKQEIKRCIASQDKYANYIQIKTEVLTLNRI